MEALKPADVEPTYQECNDSHIALSAKKCRRHRACLHIYLCHPSVVLFCKNYISSAWKTLVSLGNIFRQGEAKMKSGQESRASKCCIQHEEFGGQPGSCSSQAHEWGCQGHKNAEHSTADRHSPSPYGVAVAHLPQSSRAEKQTKRLWSNSAFAGDKFGVTSLTSVELFQNCTSVKEGSICFLKMDAIKLIENNRCIKEQQEGMVMFQFSCKIPCNFPPENVRE